MTEKKSYTRIYNVWREMKKRCNNPNSTNYKYYGGRGIKVCSEWGHSSDAFIKWAYLHGYDDKLEIDRIDPDGDYEPDNCQWVTKSENLRRRRRSYSSKEYWDKRRNEVLRYCERNNLRID